MKKRNFFIWASGGNLRIINRLQIELRPTEWNKFFGIGVSVCFTSIMAVISASFALRYIVKDNEGNPNWWIAILFGLFWGGFIFFLDRTLVTSVKKTESLRKNFLSMLPRMMLAFVFAFIISKPLEIELFRHAFQTVEDKVSEEATGFLGMRIDSLISENRKLQDEIDNFSIDKYADVTKRRFQEAETAKNILIARNDRIISNINAGIAKIRAQRRTSLGFNSVEEIDDLIEVLSNDSLRGAAEERQLAELKVKKSRWAKYVDQIIKEQRRRNPYEAEKSRYIETADSLKTIFLKVESQGDSIYRDVLIPKNQQRIAENEQSISRLRSEREKSKANFKGIWADLRAYNKYKEDKPNIQFAGWLIFVLLLAFEMAPILTKMAFKYSQYDRLLESLNDKDAFKALKGQKEKEHDNFINGTSSIRNEALDKLRKFQKDALGEEVNGSTASERYMHTRDLIKKFHYSSDTNEERIQGDLSKLSQDHHSFTIRWASKKMMDEIREVLDHTQDQRVFNKISRYIKNNGVNNLIAEDKVLDYRELEKLYKEIGRTAVGKKYRKKQQEVSNSSTGWEDESDFRSANRNGKLDKRDFLKQAVQVFKSYWVVFASVFLLGAAAMTAYFFNVWSFSSKKLYTIARSEIEVYQSPSNTENSIETFFEGYQVLPLDTVSNQWVVSINEVGQKGDWVRVKRDQIEGWIFLPEEGVYETVSLRDDAQLFRQADIKSTTLNTYLAGERLVLLEKQGSIDTIVLSGRLVKDRWLKVGLNDLTGWIFAYGTDLNNHELIEQPSNNDQKAELPSRVPGRRSANSPNEVNKTTTSLEQVVQEQVTQEEPKISLDTTSIDQSKEEKLTEAEETEKAQEENSDAQESTVENNGQEKSEFKEGDELISSGEKVKLFSGKELKSRLGSGNKTVRNGDSFFLQSIEPGGSIFKVSYKREIYYVRSEEVKKKTD